MKRLQFLPVWTTGRGSRAREVWRTNWNIGTSIGVMLRDGQLKLLIHVEPASFTCGCYKDQRANKRTKQLWLATSLPPLSVLSYRTTLCQYLVVQICIVTYMNFLWTKGLRTDSCGFSLDGRLNSKVCCLSKRNIFSSLFLAPSLTHTHTKLIRYMF